MISLHTQIKEFLHAQGNLSIIFCHPCTAASHRICHMDSTEVAAPCLHGQRSVVLSQKVCLKTNQQNLFVENLLKFHSFQIQLPKYIDLYWRPSYNIVQTHGIGENPRRLVIQRSRPFKSDPLSCSTAACACKALCMAGRLVMLGDVSNSGVLDLR